MFGEEKLIIIDIQPAYKKFIDFDIGEFISWLNDSSFDEIYCLYNGPELGYEDTENSIRNWYWEWGLNDDVELKFFEKSYGWFRDFMEDMDEENIVSIGKYMIENNILDSRDFSKKDIKILKKKNINTRFLGTDSRVMYIPELENYFTNNIYSRDHIFTCGGGVNECFKEVCLLLDMIDIRYEEKIKFIY